MLTRNVTRNFKLGLYVRRELSCARFRIFTWKSTVVSEAYIYSERREQNTIPHRDTR